VYAELMASILSDSRGPTDKTFILDGLPAGLKEEDTDAEEEEEQG
jgi:hypothetical protein